MKMLERMSDMALKGKKLDLSFYNRGIIANIKEVCFPPALYQQQTKTNSKFSN